MLMIRSIIAILAALALASCTYAPRSTKIDNTYNARQMAVGVGDQPQDAMTSTTYQGDAMPKDYSRYTNKQLADEIVRQELLKSLGR